LAGRNRDGSRKRNAVRVERGVMNAVRQRNECSKRNTKRNKNTDSRNPENQLSLEWRGEAVLSSSPPPGGVSYLEGSPTKNPEEKDPPRSRN